ncbi:putative cytochrome C1 heme lyase [Podospora fimiseda]|uniref:Holocytochrome c-type synthase n=1 Tax=Podospora fimiseda TaxID=252190 RepID=A0AAN7BYC7_9PEZI|nr:putative cytochrome C1 heme lyase [Podospora fimiseda]
MHNDLLDTVLVSKDVALGGKEAAAGKMSPSSKPEAGAPAAAAEDKCPVDHKTRDLWMQQARAAQQAKANNASSNIAPPPHPVPVPESTTSSSSSSWSSWFRLPFTSSTPTSPPPAATPPQAKPKSILDETRTISSIPRSSTSTDPYASSASRPSNHEQETGASPSGHWIYPSEKQFFEAMKRKGFASANAADMKTVVPIHNAVNEKAWAEILKWEEPYKSESEKCGGPKLYSFAGEQGKMTPKARLNTLLGYTAPFDRHDWVVDRCGSGKQVEYVIDFYSGRGGGDRLNFYLDVRPKLNSWEGIKMRFAKATGLV